MGRYYYAVKWPAPAECSDASWTRCKKCNAPSIAEAKGRLVRHLAKSSNHNWEKEAAIAAADALLWAHHDESDEEAKSEVKEEQESAPPSPLREPSPRRERSPRRRRSTPSCGSRATVSVSSNFLAIAPIGGRARSEDDGYRQRQAEFNKRLASIEAAVRAARHAERLSSSAAVAFATEAFVLESALMVLLSL